MNDNSSPQLPGMPTADKPAQMFTGSKAVQSMRDAGYRDTEKALAEIIDNSFEAEAENVVVVIVQERGKFAEGQKNATLRMTELFVLDDGLGMDKSRTNFALSFGGGTRGERKGMGRFGMGLPQSSVSQARRVDLWSWQSGFGTGHHTRIDLDEMEQTGEMAVPWPMNAMRSWSRLPVPNNHAPSGAGFKPEEEVKAGELEDWQTDPGSGEDHRAGLALPHYLTDPSLGVAREIFEGGGKTHGTIVGWSKIDRTNWTTAQGVADNLTQFLGRVYRNFLLPEDSPALLHNYDLSTSFSESDAETLTGLVLDFDKLEDEQNTMFKLGQAAQGKPRNLIVRLLTRREESDGSWSYAVDEIKVTKRGERIDGLTSDGHVRPNDPMYLAPAGTVNLRRFDKVGEEQMVTEEAPFQLYKSPQVLLVPSRRADDDSYYPVIITTTYSKPEARVGEQAGDSRLGKHAKKNSGLSVMRADRELELVDELRVDTQRRFMGLSVEFSPKLDETFGVTNNKQEATLLTQALRLALRDSNWQKSLAELVDDGVMAPDSPIAAIYPVAAAIVNRDRPVFKKVKKQKAGSRSGDDGSDPASATPEADHAVQVDDTLPPEELTAGEKKARQHALEHPEGIEEITVEDIKAGLRDAIERGRGAGDLYTSEDIEDLAEWLYEGGHGYAFIDYSDEDDPAFFAVDEIVGSERARGRTKIIKLNAAHPFWDHYLDNLQISDDDLEVAGEVELRQLLRLARGAIVSALIGWARMELTSDEGSAERALRASARENWGKQARRYVYAPGEDDQPRLSDMLFGAEE